MTQRPHFRREVIPVAGFDVWVWSCKTINRVGYGQSWRTALEAWEHLELAALGHCGEPLKYLKLLPHSDMTLQ